MPRYTAYAVFDESGDPGKNKGASRHLVVAAIVCDNLEPLRKAVMRVRRTLPKSLRGKAEMRAFETPEAARPVLASLAKLDARIYAAVVDKRRVSERNPIALLTIAYAACTSAALQTEDGIIATIDRPFTDARQRQTVLVAMADAAEELDKRLIVVMDDSQHEKALQAADVVAWALFQRHERNNEEFYQVIQARISDVLMLP
jgi:hypothetical protein